MSNAMIFTPSLPARRQWPALAMCSTRDESRFIFKIITHLTYFTGGRYLKRYSSISVSVKLLKTLVAIICPAKATKMTISCLLNRVAITS
jgi:hypothetical protein